MKSTAAYLEHLIFVMVLGVAGGLPLVVSASFTEFYEVPKMGLLVAATLVMWGLWIVSWIVKGKVSIVKTSLDLPMVGMLILVVVSTLMSLSRYPAIFGNFPRMHGSAISLVTYVLLYFVAASNLRTTGKIRTLLYVLYASGSVVTLLTLAAFFGVYLPWDFTKVANFTPTGATFSTVAMLIALMPWPLIALAKPTKLLPVPVALAVATLFGLTVAVVGNLMWVGVMVGVVAVSLFLSNFHNYKSLSLFLVPGVVVVLALVMVYTPFPGNGVQSRAANFPREIQLPFDISWKVSASAFRDAPVFGTGPATYLFNMTAYKPTEFNATSFWGFGFDLAHNEFLHLWATLALVGLGILVLVCLIVLNVARSVVFSHLKGDEADHSHGMYPALMVTGLAMMALLAVHTSTLMFSVLMVILLGALLMMRAIGSDKVEEYHLGFKAVSSDNRQFDLVPVIIFAVFLVGAIPALYQGYRFVMADFYHRQALVVANVSGNQTYLNLQKAESLNPYVDLYRVDMAQTNFALANGLASQKGPSQANPQGSLTEQDKQTIQTLLSQAVTEARVAVALSPLSARNWENLATIYRNITGVSQNALTFSLDAYGRAIQRDPLNPVLRLNVGGLYYSVKNYDLAVRFFTDAVNLKPDYANAYYNLAIALRDKGDLTNASLVADQTVALLAGNKDDASYKTAVELQTDLKAKTAAAKQSAEKPGLTGPASGTNSALNNPRLPDVNVPALNNPPAVTPPPQVEKNPNAVLP